MLPPTTGQYSGGRPRGILCAVIICLGFIATCRAKAYIFEVRTIQIFAVYTGYYLIDLMLIGAIVGAWKEKTRYSTVMSG